MFAAGRASSLSLNLQGQEIRDRLEAGPALHNPPVPVSRLLALDILVRNHGNI
jgi:hypothetical protein